MHCIVLSSPNGKGVWYISRSAEVLGYHRLERRARILFMLVAKNLLPSGRPNTLGVLHRGNNRFTRAHAWPLPRHPDEKPEFSQAKGVLEQLYGEAFEFDEQTQRVYRRQVLSPDDTWRLGKRTEVTLWEGEAREIPSPKPEGFEGYVPFTSWTLGPFDGMGHYLIAFELEVSGESYDRLVEEHPFFTIDGPYRLLDEIEYGDLPRLAQCERGEWMRLLGPFKDEASRLDSVSYDLVILGGGRADATVTSADKIEVEQDIRPCGACEAPRQDPGLVSKRFLTFNPFFSIAVKYAAGRIAARQPDIAGVP